MAPSTQFRHVEDVIDASPISRMQYGVYITCFFLVGIDGFDSAVVAFLAPVIRQEWQLGPNSLALLLTAALLGGIIGSVLLGPAADIFGRTRTVLVATVTYGAMTALSYFAQNLMTLFLLRLAAGICFGGVLPCAIALTAEFSPARRRSFLITAMFCGFMIGAASAGFLVAWMAPLMGWRAVMVVGGSAAVVIAAIAGFVLPESLNFLVAKKANPALIKHSLQRIAPHVAATGWMPEEPLANVRATTSALFRARPIFGTMLLWICSFVALMCVYLLSSWLPILLTTEGYSLTQASVATAMFQIGGLVGCVLLGLVMDKFNPSRVLMITWAGSAISLLGLAVFAHMPIAASVAIFLAGFSIPGGQIGSSAYAAAWYPTHVRATGISWMGGVGRVGSLLGALVMGGLLSIGLHMSAIIAMLGLPMVVAAWAIGRHGRVRIEN